MENQVKAIFGELEQGGDKVNNQILTKKLNEKLGKVYKKDETFFKFAQGVVDKKKSLGMVHKAMQTTVNLLDEFNPELSFKSFDLLFYDKFLEFLLSKNFSKNYIGKNIKTILNEATEKGINKNMAYKSTKFKAFTEDVYNIYLTNDELKKLQDYDFSKELKLERVRDLFLVGYAKTGRKHLD